MRQTNSSSSGNTDKIASELIGITLGTGFFAFMYKGEVLYAIHQEIGNPVGTQFEAKIQMSLILLAPGRNQEEKLRELCAEAYSATLKETNGTFLVFRFLPQSEFWKRESEVSTRPIESVILDPVQKQGLLKDLKQFLAKDSRDFYARHGIPYKRSYLLHGVPGSGKTSLIQALAGHLGRSICYIQPSHPTITDDNLRAAFQRLPSKAIVVLEDIDSLFDANRKKEVQNSPLTFSGLLNALDGVGGAEGQLVFMTTNFKDRLDSALIRKGRVDIQVEFGYASEWQMEEYFRQFYPKAPSEMASEFATCLRKELDGHKLEISTASLQHFFVVHRFSEAEDALKEVSDIREELNLRKKEDKSDGSQEKASGSLEKNGSSTSPSLPWSIFNFFGSKL